MNSNWEAVCRNLHIVLLGASGLRSGINTATQLGLRSLSDVGGFLRVLRFPSPTKTVNCANICAVSGLALLFEA